MILLPNRQSEALPSAPSIPSPPAKDPSPTQDPSPTSEPLNRRQPDNQHRRVWRWWYVALLTLCATWLFVACSPGDDRVESYVGITISDESVTDYVETRRQELNIPGLSLAIVNRGQVVYTETFGHADIEAGLPVTDETIFEAGSISKPVFAHFVMTFVDDGTLDLDRPLHEYLPHPDTGDDERAERITARMALSHQGGFPNWRDDSDGGLLPIYFEPGSDYEYSGEGYQYLALVLLELADTDWVGLEELFQERVAEPLGLERTVFMPTPLTQRHKAEPYDEDGVKIDWRNEPSPWSGFELDDDLFVAPASLHTDAAELSAWMIALMNREVLTPESYEELLAPHASPPPVGIPLSYTLGFYSLDLPFTDLYGHDGNNEGFTSSLMFDAEDDWGFVLLTNSEFGQVLGEDLLGFLLVGPDLPKLGTTIVAAGVLATMPLVIGFAAIRRVRNRRRLPALPTS